MTTKEYLSRAFEIDRRLQIKYRRFKVMQDRASGSYYRNESVTVNQLYLQSRMEEYALKAIELQAEITEDKALLEAVRSEIKQAIRSTGNELYVSILDMRYLQYMSWEEICSQTGYSRSNAYRIHGIALDLIVLPEKSHE